MLVLTSAILFAGALAAFAAAYSLIRARNLQYWIGAYIRGLWRGRPRTEGPIHVLVGVTDHFEPGWNAADVDLQRARVQRWVDRLPELASRHRDAEDRPFQYTFFYPEEQYSPELLGMLADLKRRGFGEVEVHLHHDNDTDATLRSTLTRFAETLYRRHDLLRLHPETGQIAYGFIHGNWALDNALPDGRWCGVNNEITVLQETGCFCDFTLPAAPDAAQTRKINSIYYAVDDPDRPKSHDTGADATVGVERPAGLMLIQGPLTLNWRNRSHGLLPRIENGELTGDNPPSPARAALWIDQHVHVKGRPEWVFVKLHTHGADERDTDVLLGKPLDETLSFLERHYNDGQRYLLHYVTAWDMYNIVRAAEAGCRGNPATYRDWTSRRLVRGGQPVEQSLAEEGH
jgi:hypothetical protein